MHRFCYFALAIALFSACTEKETINEIKHDNRIFEDNVPPPFEGVTTVELQNYINKVYIDLIGRQPTPDELDVHTNALKNAELADEAKEALVQEVMADDTYNDRLWEIYRNNYLGGITKDDITYQLFLYSEAYSSALYNGDTLLANYYMYEIDRYDALNKIEEEYKSGTIGMPEAMSRIAYNLVYEEINMGSENFVLACFENFLKRYPTENELGAAVLMVDGFPAQLLLSDGSSKTDFLSVVTQNTEFLQGLTIDIYRSLLSRLPDSPEMGAATALLQNGSSYQAIQLQVLISAEYAGF